MNKGDWGLLRTVTAFPVWSSGLLADGFPPINPVEGDVCGNFMDRFIVLDDLRTPVEFGEVGEVGEVGLWGTGLSAVPREKHPVGEVGLVFSPDGDFAPLELSNRFSWDEEWGVTFTEKASVVKEFSGLFGVRG